MSQQPQSPKSQPPQAAKPQQPAPAQKVVRAKDGKELSIVDKIFGTLLFPIDYFALEELEVERDIDYGGSEIRKKYRRYHLLALLFAVLIVGSMIGTYWLTIYLQQEEEPVIMVRIMKYSELGPPPSMTNADAAPSVAVSGPAVKPTVGIPVPVPDAEVSPEQTIATQKELSQIAGQGNEGGTGTGQIQKDISVEDKPEQKLDIDEAPPDFVPFEQAPTPVKQVSPNYPDIARRAELEGSVIVKAWVDREGKVKKAVVLKSDAEVFNQPAIDAAMQWVFTPALQQKKPVAVWVAIPFKFRLNNAK